MTKAGRLFHVAFAVLAAVTTISSHAYANGGGTNIGGRIQVPSARKSPVTTRWSCSGGSHFCGQQQNRNGWIVRDQRANPSRWSPDSHATRVK